LVFVVSETNGASSCQHADYSSPEDLSGKAVLFKFTAVTSLQITISQVYDVFNPFLHIYTFMAWANSVDPDQMAHPCNLIRICTFHFFIYLGNFWLTSKQCRSWSNGITWICKLIWIYTVIKRVYLEKNKLNHHTYMRELFGFYYAPPEIRGSI
jgi:hypothetical protein